jgi:hypothetical protein
MRKSAFLLGWADAVPGPAAAAAAAAAASSQHSSGSTPSASSICGSGACQAPLRAERAGPAAAPRSGDSRQTRSPDGSNTSSESPTRIMPSSTPQAGSRCGYARPPMALQSAVNRERHPGTRKRQTARRQG